VRKNVGLDIEAVQTSQKLDGTSRGGGEDFSEGRQSKGGNGRRRGPQPSQREEGELEPWK
jgi:hypothetical protein